MPAISPDFHQQLLLSISKSTATIAEGKCTMYLANIHTYMDVGPLQEVNGAKNGEIREKCQCVEMKFEIM